MRIRFSICLLFFLLSPEVFSEASLNYTVLRVLSHEIEDSTQGLEVHDDVLAESTGGFGRSKLRLKALDGMRLLGEVDLPKHHFGEGVTRVDNRWIQLTWRNGVAHVYDLNLREQAQWRFEGEGWCLCFNGGQIVMSDGSSKLQRRDPQSFELLGRVEVKFGGKPLHRLNELECVAGLVLANVWLTDVVVLIDPRSGEVLGYWDFSDLRMRFQKPPAWNPREDVLNGIAYKPSSDSYLLTGKRWPALFEISLEWPAEAAVRPER